ncbi:DUF3857 domain-containing protein [Erythrobacter litoralis]|uniref:DUF3857 domain-containing protein n=1 Tax=Erythrobacter litoralis TaxID=39960 RepID=UPI002435DF58|nr:DUF3857 domain-containing protein [Erythrobacter litoralis]MDG6078391.1 DUF3857 domain-containing protein [Erythrobacter litoralis]
MNVRVFLSAAPIALVSTAAFAGEDVRYETAPAWVVPADIDTAMENREELVIYDRQIRFENGVVHRYNDIAYDLRNPEMLSKFGTLQLGWMPDKGDLIVHKLELLRDGETIDLLAQGVTPEVIRRETELERRSLDGALTALVKVPGAKIGDVLRFAVTTTTRDQALDGEVQAIEGYFEEPGRVGFGRLRMSWPADSDIHFTSIGDVDLPDPVTENGFTAVDVSMPIVKQDEMPKDAPGRFRMQPMLMAGSFSTWEDVAAVMAPHYATENTIVAGSPLAKEVARIEKVGSNDLERAALALQSVQEEINYLMNGMNGGNYLPQTPADTWELRYGDCKAKSMLLLSMLHELGIEADAVLVKTDNGDSVSRWQPLPGAFDHVIVRASIEGKDYWLDGTSSGARLATIDEVPGFAYGLPIAEKGAELVKLEQRWPSTPDRTMWIVYDYSRGVDMPGLVEFNVETRGSLASWMQSKVTETELRSRIGYAQQYFENFIDAVFYDAEFGFDQAKGIGTLKAKGLVLEPFALERNMASLPIYTASTNWELDADRSRAAWREIPYALGGPMTKQYEVTYLLPDGTKASELRGEPDLEDQVVAGTRFWRDLEMNGDRIVVKDFASYIPGEIAPQDIAPAKSAMRTLASKDPVLRLTDPVRSWELSDAEMRKRAEGLLAPANALVAMAEDEAAMPAFRAYLHMTARDNASALADAERAIDQSASAETHQLKADILSRMGRYEEAAEAAEAAFALNNDLASGIYYATLLANAGHDAEALEVLDQYDLGGDDGADIAMIFAEIAGNTPRADEAWERLAIVEADRPGDGSVLNSQCWFMATWSYNLDEGAEVCDRAVKAGDYGPAVLDSRALMYHRLGRDEDALKDIESALRKSPGMAASMYLRGIIQTKNGKAAEGRRDIEQALRIEPTLAKRYEKYGLTMK